MYIKASSVFMMCTRFLRHLSSPVREESSNFPDMGKWRFQRWNCSLFYYPVLLRFSHWLLIFTYPANQRWREKSNFLGIYRNSTVWVWLFGLMVDGSAYNFVIIRSHCDGACVEKCCLPNEVSNFDLGSLLGKLKWSKIKPKESNGNVKSFRK